MKEEIENNREYINKLPNHYQFLKRSIYKEK
jgi:hypothetical protein